MSIALLALPPRPRMTDNALPFMQGDMGVIQWPVRAARGLSVWLGLVLASVCICFVKNYLNRLGRRVAV